MTKIVDKLAWIPIHRHAVLFARSRGQTLFYNTGGKRKPGESDEQALIREVEEETSVTLLPHTIRHIHTFEGLCYGAPEGTLLQMACYDGEGDREPRASNEVEELTWFTSADAHRTTEMGQTILRWLAEQGLID
jgi:8-oxo-dGTP diphosphatase